MIAVFAFVIWFWLLVTIYGDQFQTRLASALRQHSKTRQMGDANIKRFGALPSAAGAITRLACAQAKAAGVDVGPLLQKAGITQQQIDDPSARLNVRDQIRFVGLAANVLQDDFLGFHLAQLSDLRELGLLYTQAEGRTNELLQCMSPLLAQKQTLLNEGANVLMQSLPSVQGLIGVNNP